MSGFEKSDLENQDQDDRSGCLKNQGRRVRGAGRGAKWCAGMMCQTLRPPGLDD